MDGGKSKGRARGRGRGDRARGRAHKEQEVLRPGQREQEAAKQPTGAQGPQPPAASQGLPPPRDPRPPPPTAGQGAAGQGAAAEEKPGSGRAVRRGTSRAQDARPGEQQQEVEEVTGGVQALGLQEGGAGEGAAAAAGAGAEGQRRRENRYEDRQFRDVEKNKKGTSGTVITIRGNFFKMRAQDEWRVYQYHVDYMPPCESTKMRKALLYTHDNLIFGPVKAFDGMILYLPYRLQDDETVVHSYTREENRQIKITIKFTCELINISPSTIQLMNIIWRRFLSMMNMKQINRHYFDMENRIQVPEHKLEVIPGFQTSILRYESDVLLDIDITHKVLRTQTVLDQLYELGRRLGYMSDDYFKQAMKDIVGTVVLTRYNNKTYTVDDIHWEGKITDTFERNNQQISYEAYYKRQYDVTIKEHQQPLLVTRAKKRDLRRGEASNIFLVPELCIITGLTEANRADFNLKRDLATHTRVNPGTRVSRLVNFMRDLKGNEKVVNELKGWGLSLDDDLMPIQARQMNQEQLLMLDRGNNVSLSYKQEESDWSRDMRGKTMRSAPKLGKWVIIFPRRCSGNARNLCDSLRRVGPPMGMNIEHPEPHELEGDRNDAYLQELRRCVIQGQTQMVVCVLPNNRKDRYDAIKKFCCIDRPVPSQMVTDRTLGNKNRLMSVATKIAIQMNCKLGGVVWSTPIPLKQTMIIGFDTYHDSSKKGRSVGGVVATINSDFTRYYSTATFQTSHVELLNQLQSCVKACINAYQKFNKGESPQKVVVYRDGVGDGQLNLVYDHEIPQVQAAIGDAKLTFIVVKKRTIARFFVEGGDGAAGRGDPRGRGGGAGGQRRAFSNPGPGTIIDDVATKPTWSDFFLISQSVREGTVTPTHYNVILNEIDLVPEYYQRLSYKLTHMYYNWQGTIRVPAPCMYAHKLAFLVGQSLHQHPDASLADKLYYL